MVIVLIDLKTTEYFRESRKMFMDISALFVFIEPKCRGPPTPFNFSNLKLNGGN